MKLHSYSLARRDAYYVLIATFLKATLIGDGQFAANICLVQNVLTAIMLPIPRQGCRLRTTTRLSRIPSVRRLDTDGACTTNIPQKRQLYSPRGDVTGRPLAYAPIRWPGSTNSPRHRLLNSGPMTASVHRHSSPVSYDRSYSTSQSSKKVTVDDYIQEIEDL